MWNLRKWVRNYTGQIRLAVSERGSDSMPVCDPLVAESGLRSFAHIDARGVIKECSYSSDGVSIGADGVIAALGRLSKRSELVK